MPSSSKEISSVCTQTEGEPLYNDAVAVPRYQIVVLEDNPGAVGRNDFILLDTFTGRTWAPAKGRAPTVDLKSGWVLMPRNDEPGSDE